MIKPFLLTLLLLAQPTLAETVSPAERLVARYTEYDFAGDRLSSRTAGAIMSLVAWPEESGWDMAYAISDYELRGLSATQVEVIYHQTGVCPDAGSGDKQEDRRVIFTVDPVAGLIRGPVIAPRVSAELLCRRNGCCHRHN